MGQNEIGEHLPLSPREFLVLYALLEGELHGYGIVKRIDRESSGSVLLDPSNLYRMLKRLLAKHLVAESERPAPDLADEQRRYYALTDLGKEVVEAEARRLHTITEAVLERTSAAQPRAGE